MSRTILSRLSKAPVVLALRLSLLAELGEAEVLLPMYKTSDVSTPSPVSLQFD